MRITLLAIGKRLPDWQEAGVKTFIQRLPKHWHFQLKTSNLSQRDKKTSEQILKQVPADNQLIALDERGSAWSSQELASKLEIWQADQQDMTLLIGGPDGLAPECKARAHQTWSLSPLTLPHGLVRILVVEQLYRAHTLLIGHPYHRD